MHRASIHWRKASLCFLVYVVVQAVCASEAEEFDCTDRSNGDYEDPKSACASHYYSCFASTTLKRHCPKGLVYNPRLKRCDWRESVPGCGGANPDRRKPHFECPQRDGLFAVQDCSPQYWRCSGGEPVKMACAEGQAFDGRSKKCAAIGNVLACNLKIQQEVPKVRQEAPNDKRQAADVSKAAKQEIKKSGHRNEGRSGMIWISLANCHLPELSLLLYAVSAIFVSDSDSPE
ncbi:unnamed protein product [Soboliphyme baturini]|uniref:Chitin-binding type-2 domain-containing protein n=1 Tax=Soboliphyme baturini TaxID=241478 RepID=A0A183J5N6_9BILA|nr:unnamed protein product [Soboliphyme baturini]